MDMHSHLRLIKGEERLCLFVKTALREPNQRGQTLLPEISSSSLLAGTAGTQYITAEITELLNHYFKHVNGFILLRLDFNIII